MGCKPDRHQVAGGPQVVNVPVRAGGYPPVVLNTGRQAARPKGATDVYVESPLQLQHAEPADPRLAGLVALQHERVRTGLSCQPNWGKVCFTRHSYIGYERLRRRQHARQKSALGGDYRRDPGQPDCASMVGV